MKNKERMVFKSIFFLNEYLNKNNNNDNDDEMVLDFKQPNITLNEKYNIELIHSFKPTNDLRLIISKDNKKVGLKYKYEEIKSEKRLVKYNKPILLDGYWCVGYYISGDKRPKDHQAIDIGGKYVDLYSFIRD